MKNKIILDFNEKGKKIKKLHGVNNGPKTMIFHFDTSEYFKEADIPFARLHDTEYPYGSQHFVDIPCIFKDFQADPDDPESYDFILTDEYIKAIVDCGTKVFYRLGVSIEHASKKYNIFPPADNLKWAKICEGIIRHYNEGWANGFYYGIEYWEIWNEPDNHPEAKLNPMWQGTKEQYFKLYEISSNYLKSKFPGLKIGGYGHCGFYALVQQDGNNEGSKRLQYFIDFFHEFLDYITSDEHKSPLDFFSWHTYSGDIDFYKREVMYVREILDKYGFINTESILNEWNYAGADMFINMRNMKGASCVASVFCEMQKLPLDSAMYYDAQPCLPYCGIFDYPVAKPTKTYYSFKAFNELYKLGTEVKTVANAHGLYVCAAANGNKGALMAVNYGHDGSDCDFILETIGAKINVTEVLLLNDEYSLEKAESKCYKNNVITLGNDTLVFIRYTVD